MTQNLEVSIRLETLLIENLALHALSANPAPVVIRIERARGSGSYLPDSLSPNRDRD